MPAPSARPPSSPSSSERPMVPALTQAHVFGMRAIPEASMYGLSGMDVTPYCAGKSEASATLSGHAARPAQPDWQHAPRN